MDTTEALVVGAGPAGLTTAVALARAGVDVLVVDRHAGTSPFPKSTGVSTRTMELLRTWGLEDRVRAAAIPLRQLVTVSDTLVGPETRSTPTGYPLSEQALAVSPSTPCYCPQDHLEPVLLAHLVARVGRIRFRTELTALRTDPATGVTAALLDRDTGRRYRARARYVVGADGPASTVRAALGIGVEELGTLGDYVAATFHADLTRRMPRAPSAINVVETPGPGLLVPTSTAGRWIYGHPPVDGPRDYPEVIRQATGVPDLRIRLESVQSFTMGAHAATALRSVCGRGFVVGDAAHRTTPEGGIGMNTAIHAAHNLGWKLAMVLRGHAGDALLDSYQDERLPVGRANAARSLQGPIPDGLSRELGVVYRSAVVDPAGGARAPHAWVRHAGRRVSTVELFDGRFTVLTGRDGDPWRAAASGLAAGGLPIAGLSVGRAVHPVDGVFGERYRLGAEGAVLVRPDGFVAWRHDGPARHAATALRAAVHAALGRTGHDAVLDRAG